MNIFSWIWNHTYLESKIEIQEYELDKLKSELKLMERWNEGYLSHIEDLEKDKDELRTDLLEYKKNYHELCKSIVKGTGGGLDKYTCVVEFEVDGVNPTCVVDNVKRGINDMEFDGSVKVVNSRIVDREC